jgi:hypothetical protein
MIYKFIFINQFLSKNKFLLKKISFLYKFTLYNLNKSWPGMQHNYRILTISIKVDLVGNIIIEY